MVELPDSVKTKGKPKVKLPSWKHQSDQKWVIGTVKLACNISA